jgi:hypothetical protein
MDELQQLFANEAIKILRARYFRYIDMRSGFA